MSLKYNQFKCPLCGKSNSTRKYDPSDFEDDIIGVNKVGLGQGLGFGIDAEGSILESEEPVMVRLTDRVAVLYDLLYEEDKEEEEVIEEINEALEPYYDESFGEGFDNIIDASIALLNQFLEQKEDDNDEDESIDTQDFEDLSDIDKEIWIVEYEGNDDEDSE